jgi:hypothetical protein
MRYQEQLDMYIWKGAYHLDLISCKTFRSLIGHGSFDPNGYNGRDVPTLLRAFVDCMKQADWQRPTEGTIEKFEALMEAGADPLLELDGQRSVLDVAKSHFADHYNSRTLEIGMELLELMRERVDMKTTTASGREILLRTLLKNNVHSLSNEEFAKLAEATHGCTLTNLEELCRDAAMSPIIRELRERFEEVAAEDVRPISYMDFLKPLYETGQTSERIRRRLTSRETNKGHDDDDDDQKLAPGNN